ncbi:hypothetical protein AB0J86_06380 [Micromonospora sp. NPDC049559]|uniref:hypothetical protein n=1 Tax=Micromonospora sp. NPDC049559 TaxID=3155923 RepID=UPI003415E576
MAADLSLRVRASVLGPAPDSDQPGPLAGGAVMRRYLVQTLVEAVVVLGTLSALLILAG